MIEESLLKSNFIGKDGFVWWIGQVADPSVWRNEKTRIDAGNDAWGYRCKVRIVGYHSFDRNELDDDELPWAHVLTSAADGSPGQGGFGKLPMLIGGESVVGFFIDGDEAQQPVVMGCFHRSPAVVNVDNPNPFEPFTGQKGYLVASPTRQKKSPEAAIKEIASSLGSGSQFSVSSNPSFGVGANGLDVDAGFAPLSSDTSGSAGAVWTHSLETDKLFYDTKAEVAFLHKFDTEPPVQTENGCSTNIIGSIQATLSNFIKFVNGLESTAYGFIDPLRNKIVDISGQIRKVARLIASLMKVTINGMRDNIFQLVGCLFRGISATLPQPLKLPISEATKNILDLIFCIFEKLFGPLWDFIESLLNGLIGKTPSIPTCAVEETVASLIDKLAQMADDALSTILSGLDWLADGIGQVGDYIRQGLNFVQQILSFLDCDALTCGEIKSWDPFEGVNLPSADAWEKILDNVDILGAFDENIDLAIGFLSMFGSEDTPFGDCRETALNPTTQSDAPSIPLGTKWYTCIPPEIRISGDGVDAKAQAVISSLDGSILTIKVTNPGRGYSSPPIISVIDKTRYGKGAIAKSSIDENGSINSIVLVESGSGYCPTNLNDIVKTIEGVRDVLDDGIVNRDNLGISTISSGIVTSIFIDRPGYGYSSDDTIFVGNCVWTPIVSPAGSIIAINSAECIEEFETYPEVTINTQTGQGALLYPVLDYLPQFIIDNDVTRSTRVGIGTTIVNVVDCV